MFFFLLEKTKNKIAPKRSNAPTPTATPIPIFAPVLNPPLLSLLITEDVVADTCGLVEVVSGEEVPDEDCCADEIALCIEDAIVDAELGTWLVAPITVTVVAASNAKSEFELLQH